MYVHIQYMYVYICIYVNMHSLPISKDGTHSIECVLYRMCSIECVFFGLSLPISKDGTPSTTFVVCIYMLYLHINMYNTYK